MPITYLRVELAPDAAERGLAVLQQALVDTRAFEGCGNVRPFVDPGDPSKVVVREEWASREREDAYVAFRATPEGAIDGFADVLAAPPVREHVQD
ncbi:putative quinol monooxygenase [Amnibacterium endophyticum]|uniref:Quinol monooxygenase n=1 Tax=Amnibacterium endophyticum TaxID=2109337 RepID=A0ABW4LHG6_9MICO